MAYLYRSNSGASGTTATVSAWVKAVDTSVDAGVFQFKSGSDLVPLYINPVIKLRTYISSSTSNGALTSNRKIRDFSAWFNVVTTIDTTNATAADRLRVYINGERVTGFSVETYPSQNYSYAPIVSGNFELGKYSSSDRPTYLAHVHYCDGYAYNADSFGSIDSVTGEWKINTNPNVQYGSNGVFLKFANSASMVTDSSGNNNTMSLSGSCLQTQDCPSNNFATLNPLVNTNSSSTLTNGNTTHTTTANWLGEMTTIGAYTGKYYAEGKLTDRMNFSFGICQANGDTQNNMSTANNSLIGNYSDGWGFNGNNGDAYNKRHNGTQSTYGSAFADNDIFMIAMDLDNGAVYFGKNGTWFDSGNPATNTNPAYGSITFTDSVHFCSGMENGQVQWNFGNGYFGTTAISSEGSNASGIGKFEYDVPAGYTALSTKGLNE